MRRFLRAWHIARGAGWDLRLRLSATLYLLAEQKRRAPERAAQVARDLNEFLGIDARFHYEIDGDSPDKDA